MTSVNMHEAKTHLSQLVAKVEAGEEVVISRAGKPVAKLTPLQPAKRPKFGFAKGTIKIVGDINDPLPDEWLDQFYNAPICTTDKPAASAEPIAQTSAPSKSRRRHHSCARRGRK